MLSRFASVVPRSRVRERHASELPLVPQRVHAAKSHHLRRLSRLQPQHTAWRSFSRLVGDCWCQWRQPRYRRMRDRVAPGYRRTGFASLTARQRLALLMRRQPSLRPNRTPRALARVRPSLVLARSSAACSRKCASASRVISARLSSETFTLPSAFGLRMIACRASCRASQMTVPYPRGELGLDVNNVALAASSSGFAVSLWGHVTSSLRHDCRASLQSKMISLPPGVYA
jgi:hypothetical protein